MPGVANDGDDVVETGEVLMRVTCEMTIKVTATISMATDASVSLAKLRSDAQMATREWYNASLRERVTGDGTPTMSGPTVTADVVRVDFT